MQRQSANYHFMQRPISRWRPRTLWSRYLFALIISSVALGVAAYLPEELQAILLIMAIVLSAWMSGIGPGVVALFGTAAGADLLYETPMFVLDLKASDALGILVFLLVVVPLGAVYRYERVLLDQHEWFRTLLTSLGDGIIATNSKGEVQYLNPVAEDLMGWDLADAENLPLSEVFKIVNERTQEPIESPFDEVIRTGAVVNLANHTSLIKRDGTSIPIKDSGAPIYDYSRKISGVVIVFQDDTEHRQAQLALQESEERFRTMANAAPVFIWIADSVGKWTYVNKLWLSYTGHALEEEQGDGWTKSIHPDDLERTLDEFNAALTEKRPFTVEFRLRRFDWEYRDFLVRGVPRLSNNETFDGFIGSCIDITERRELQKQLEEALEHTRDLYEVSQGIGSATSFREILDALIALPSLHNIHRAHIALFDRAWEVEQPEEIEIAESWDVRQTIEPDRRGIKQKFADFVNVVHYSKKQPLFIKDVEMDERITEATRKQLLEVGSHSLIINPLIANNRFFGLISLQWEDRYNPILEDGHFLGGLIAEAAGAIYNLRLLNRESQARAIAERANDHQVRFLAMISHELRTPLTSIMGFTDSLLSTDVKWSDEQRTEFIETIGTEADKLLELVQQLLDMSRIEAGMLSINTQPVRLAKILTDLTPSLQMLASEHTLTVDQPESDMLIEVDPKRFQQVITNLVQNAAKYSPEKSAITLRAVQEDTNLRIDVMDEGPGISPEDLGKIFRAFEQLDGRKGGAGLGLAIAHGIVEAHKGRIWVEDSSEDGTTFSVILPLAETAGETTT